MASGIVTKLVNKVYVKKPNKNAHTKESDYPNVVEIFKIFGTYKSKI
jgi:hypothetical protein